MHGIMGHIWGNIYKRFDIHNGEDLQRIDTLKK